MNSPAHLVINLALLTSEPHRMRARWVAVGAILPDSPMLFFYLWERLVRGATEAAIWRERYFALEWQAFFDVFNSLPLIAIGFVAAVWRRHVGARLLFASMAIHCALDLPLHREDGHRHFLPFSDWQFISPVSYWDMAHFGAYGLSLEAAATLAASVVLWRRFPSAVMRIACSGLVLVYASGLIYLWS